MAEKEGAQYSDSSVQQNEKIKDGQEREKEIKNIYIYI